MNPIRSHNKFAFLPLLLLLLAAPPGGAASLPNFSALVEKASPAVVNISTEQNTRVGQRLPKGFSMPDLPEDSPLNELFTLILDLSIEAVGAERGVLMTLEGELDDICSPGQTEPAHEVLFREIHEGLGAAADPGAV